MIFTTENVAVPALTFQIGEQVTRIDRVLDIDTEAGEVTCLDLPARCDENGAVVTHKLKFDKIHPIYGGQSKPGLFHCYGPKGA